METRGLCPYETLFIYEILGRVEEPERKFGADFIGAWEEAEYSFLFFSSPNKEIVESVVGRIPGAVPRSETIMPYRDWEAGDKIRPIQAGKFFVYPFWLEPVAPWGSIPIKLDPGVVFGSGFHPTTRSCLMLLSQVMEHDPFPARVLDLGAGTGILSLAAAKAGASEVLAVEINNLAAATARRNAALNNLENRIRVAQGSAMENAGGEWDLVLANLTWPALADLVQTQAFGSANEIIISGLRIPEVEKLAPLLQRAGFRPLNAIEDQGWFSALIHRV